MNQQILNLYKIKFELLLADNYKENYMFVNVTSDVIIYLSGYFEQLYPDFLKEDIIPEIDKAMNGQSFNDDGGGAYHFLRIGSTTSSFYDSPTNKYDLPTSHLKEILLSYIEWIETNDYTKYIH